MFACSRSKYNQSPINHVKSQTIQFDMHLERSNFICYTHFWLAAHIVSSVFAYSTLKMCLCCPPCALLSFLLFVSFSKRLVIWAPWIVESAPFHKPDDFSTIWMLSSASAAGQWIYHSQCGPESTNRVLFMLYRFAFLAHSTHRHTCAVVLICRV